MNRLDRLKELEAAATSAPWAVKDSWIQTPGAEQLARLSHDDREGLATAALIAEVRNALPDLLAVAEAADDLMLWEPNRAGYAAALSRLQDALKPLVIERAQAA